MCGIVSLSAACVSCLMSSGYSYIYIMSLRRKTSHTQTHRHQYPLQQPLFSLLSPLLALRARLIEANLPWTKAFSEGSVWPYLSQAKCESCTSEAGKLRMWAAKTALWCSFYVLQIGLVLLFYMWSVSV